MGAEQSINVAIIGAGRGGSALIELFTRCKGISITPPAESASNSLSASSPLSGSREI